MAKVLFIVNVDWFFISHRLPIAIELIKLYKKAIALVFPSLYEGFGLPILEAMYFGLPVITSNKTSTVEVSGCSTLLCNPNDVESIAQAMERVMIDNHLRADLIEKGKIREREFSWGRTSREMLDLYDYISKKKE